MSIELPEIFQPRNLIAVGLGVATEFFLGWATYSFATDKVTAAFQNMNWNSMIFFVLFFLLTAWLISRAYRWVFVKKKTKDEIEEVRQTATGGVGVGLPQIKTPKS